MQNRLSKISPALRALMAAIFLTVIALLIYANALDAPFVFDDLPNITQSPHIRMTAFTPDSIINGTRGPSPFRPVAYLSFAVNYYFNQYHTRGYHLVNISIHAAIAVLIFFIAGLTLRLAGLARGIIPEITALIWVTHPLHVQSVTYTVQRVNSLATLFFMLGLYLYIRARLAQRNPDTGLIKTGLLFSGCAASGLLALFSKEIAATLPICIFLFEWFFFQDLDRIWQGKKTKWIILGTGIFLVLIALYLKADPVDRILSSYTEKNFTLAERLLTEPHVVIYYLSLLFFPHPARLNVDYDFPLSNFPADPIVTILCLLAIAALLLAALYRPKQHKLLSFAILWFLINLIIESSIIGLAIIFEHRTYLPSLFPVLIVTAFLIRYLPRQASLCCIVLIIITSGVWTYQRNTVWGDTLLLWQDCARKSPRIARPANGVGMAYQAGHQPEKALAWFQKAVHLDPAYDEAHSNIGGILIQMGRPAEAVPHLERAITLDPESFEALSNMGSAMRQLNRINDAIAYYRKSITIFPDYEAALNNLGAVLTEQGDFEGAMRHLNQAIRINPQYTEAYNNLGLAMMESGREEKAIICYRQALRLNPDYPPAHLNLGIIRLTKQDLNQARYHLQKAAQLNPQSVKALDKLTTVLVMQGQYQAAEKNLIRLAGLKPDNPAIYYNLACVYALQNKTAAAVDALNQAVGRGYDRWDHMKSDTDLENIYDTPYFKKLVHENVM